MHQTKNRCATGPLCMRPAALLLHVPRCNPVGCALVQAVSLLVPCWGPAVIVCLCCDGFGALHALDVAWCSYWWDYGMLKLYRKNNMLVTQDSKEAAALRTFLRITDKKAGSTIAADVDEESVVLGSDVRKGTVRCSVCASVIAGELDVKDCLLVNVTAKYVLACVESCICQGPE